MSKGHAEAMAALKLLRSKELAEFRNFKSKPVTIPKLKVKAA